MKTQAGLHVILAGSRTITDYFEMPHAIEWSEMKIQEIVRGGASGVNPLGERYAREHGIPIRLFLAGSARSGKSAGYRSHGQMAEYVDALAKWAECKGAAHTIEIAGWHGPAVYVDSKSAA